MQDATTLKFTHIEEKIVSVKEDVVKLDEKVGDIDLRVHSLETNQATFKRFCQVLGAMGTVVFGLSSWYAHNLNNGLKQEQVNSLSRIERTVMSLKRIHLPDGALKNHQPTPNHTLTPHELKYGYPESEDGAG